MSDGRPDPGDGPGSPRAGGADPDAGPGAVPTDRRVWATLLVVGLLVAVPAAPYVLVEDVHGPVAWEPVETEQPAPAVMAGVTDRLSEVDHRRVSTVTLVENGSERRYAVYEEAKDFSNYEYAATYVRYARGPETTLFGDRFDTEVSVPGPVQVVQYGDDARVALGFRSTLEPTDLPERPVGDRNVTWNGSAGVEYQQTNVRGPNRSLAALYRPYFSPRGGGWETVSRNDSVVVLGIDDPGAAFATVPMDARAVHEGTRVRAVLDADTGRPERVVESRVLTRKVEGEFRRDRYRVVTRYEDWRTLDVTEPHWVGNRSVGALVEDLLYY